jgi:hypothetical protein
MYCGRLDCEIEKKMNGTAIQRRRYLSSQGGRLPVAGGL